MSCGRGAPALPRRIPPAAADQLRLVSDSHASRRSRTLSNAGAKVASEEADLPAVGVELYAQVLEIAVGHLARRKQYPR